MSEHQFDNEVASAAELETDEGVAHNGEVSAAGETTAEQAPAELTIEEQLAAAQAQAAEHLEGWQRAVAELANARKRFNQQTLASHRDAKANVVEKLLPFVDDLDRALENAPQVVTDEEWFAGLMMVRRKFDTILKNLQVEPIEAVGHPFDPNIHEALSSEAAEGVESGFVTRELVTGYKIGDRVIRPTLVYVAD